MPLITVRNFRDGLLEDAEEIVESIVELERIRPDARTTALLVVARQFLGAIETYFEAVGEVAMPGAPVKDVESLMGIAEDAVEVARQICSVTGGPGSSALVHHASALRSATELYWQSQRRLAAEILRQLELPHQHALPSATEADR